MAEFCKECFKSKVVVPSDNITDDMLMMSAAYDICEGCGEYKQMVVGVENKYETKWFSCDMPVPQGFGWQGWVCPVCGRGLAPWVSVCPCMSKGFEITYGGNVNAKSING